MKLNIVTMILLVSFCLPLSAQQLQWIREYNGPGINKTDFANATCTDALGNVYVTGGASGYGEEVHYATIKYNNQGVMQWIAEYSDSIYFQSSASAITVDGSGNVYVTGSSGTGLGQFNNFVTVKYNSSGEQQWMARYAGPQNNDYAVALKVDGSGNVYVTGESYSVSTFYDIAIVKYNSNGVQQWAETWNGPGSYQDSPSGLALDNSGNVYVTGYTIDGNTTCYATVSFSSSGNFRWASVYNPQDNYTSIANAIVVDNQGFVYITGRSHGLINQYYTMATIKYDPSSGDSLWVKRYSAAINSQNWGYGIAVDDNNNIYVSGAVSEPGNQPWGIGVIKYNPSGDQLWASVYTDPNRQVTYGEKIALDSNGNSYIQGYSSLTPFDPEDYLTAKFDVNGVFQWIKYYNGPGNDRDVSFDIAVDNDGNSFVTGFSYAGHTSGITDYATIKYNIDGVQQWTARYNNYINGDDFVSDMKIDKSGNVYVIGTSQQQSDGSDIFVIKYNYNGDSLWAKMWDGPSDNLDRANAVDIDSSGNVYIAGASWDPDAEHNQWVTLKYDSAGNFQWSELYPGPGGGGILNAAYSVATDQSGNVYVFGLEAYSNQFTGHYLLIKYDPDGNQLWTRAGNTNSFGNNAVKVVTDGNGFVYITSRYGSDIYTIKYSSSGNLQWTATYDGSGNDDNPADLFVDNNGNVYVTGTSMQSSSETSYNYVTVKYNSSGAQQWVKIYNGPGNNFDGANAISVDTDGNVFVTGISNENTSEYDYATIKYSSSGNELWVNRFGSGNSLNFGTSVKTYGGNIYIAGGTSSAPHMNFGLLGLDAGGTQQWTTEYNSDDDSLFTRPLLSFDNDGSFYVAGSTHESGTDYSFVLIKYAVTVPVELTSFNARAVDNTVQLSWSTATETNNRGFEVQRNAVSENKWIDAGFVAGNGTATKGHNYSFVDKNLPAGKYQYRLKQIDLNGSFEYMGTVETEIIQSLVFSLSQNYPDPFNPATTINYSLSNDGKVSLKVYDILGKEISTLVNENQKAGFHSVKFNGSNLPSGVYIYRLNSGINYLTRKMIMLK
ncbi:MAG TPA: SBBP repeat-containing protein [Ignavibacteriaceae bacterium]|nr:SBBP repeat-containing protein [Ignavibacteriaceae bacterium]